MVEVPIYLLRGPKIHARLEFHQQQKNTVWQQTGGRNGALNEMFIKWKSRIVDKGWKLEFVF